MNAIGNMLEVRFPNIYILSNTIYYIFPLTKVVVLTVKASDIGNNVRQCHAMFAMHYGNIKD